MGVDAGRVKEVKDGQKIGRNVSRTPRQKTHSSVNRLTISPLQTNKERNPDQTETETTETGNPEITITEMADVAKNLKIAKYLTAISISLLLSCISDGYIKIQDTKGGVWYVDDPMEFSFTPDDTLTSYNIDILARSSADYRLDGIRMAVETLSPDSLCWIDTVMLNIPPAQDVDPYRTGVQTYRSGVQFARNGMYMFRIRQLTGENPLKDIQGVGLVINKGR